MGVQINYAAWVITLDRSEDRRKIVAQRMMDQGIVFRWHSGIDGAEFNLSFRNNMNAGECGCALSHYTLWQTIRERTEPIHIVFEDDIAFKQPFWPYFEKVMAMVPPDWGIARLGHRDIDCEKRNKVAESDGITLYRGGSSETHCYCVTKRFVVEKIHDLHASRSDLMPIDNLFAARTNSWKALIAVPSVCGQDREIMPPVIGPDRAWTK